ncbi:MAG: hypothetical protein HY033_13555 [Ignavibacteriae bacterium]|nr:hypothetical protein [Ignavibacteria bacterium]MBI3365918.1 hypothetical protein [Ignavibacteriota bacterium]
MFSTKILALLSCLFILTLPVCGQDSITPSRSDSSAIASLDHMANLPTNPPKHSWGIDLLISTGGFGLGGFYRNEYSDDLSGFLDFSISEAHDDDEKEFVDYYGNKFTPGKVNRFLVMPLFVGLQKRLFKDDILDNFRPYINVAAGPTMIYVFPYNDEYFTALGKGQPKYTIGGYIGVGAFFGSERSSLLGMNLRYYFLPYFSDGLESLRNPMTNETLTKKEFGGFFITVNFGSAW